MDRRKNGVGPGLLIFHIKREQRLGKRVDSDPEISTAFLGFVILSQNTTSKVAALERIDVVSDGKELGKIHLFHG